MLHKWPTALEIRINTKIKLEWSKNIGRRRLKAKPCDFFAGHIKYLKLEHSTDPQTEKVSEQRVRKRYKI